MPSMKEIFGEAGVDALQTVSENAGQKYLCFTRLTSDAWIICVTDGFELWRLALDPDELETHRDLAEVNTTETFLVRFRTAFSAGQVHVTRSGSSITMQVGIGVNSLSFKLFEAKAIEKKTEFSTVLFQLAESMTDLKSQLEKANRIIDTLQQSKGSSPIKGGMVDPDIKKRGSKSIKTSANMSVINPASRKRKTAEGVQFE